MTIRHLKIFVTVAECKKMNVAAKQLYISQPSVSQAISELEKHYGCLLFERLAQKLFITKAGEKLLPYARNVVASFEEIEHMMKLKGQQPVVRIGASVSVGTCKLIYLIEEMKKEHPQVDLEAVVNNTEKIEDKIVTGQLDLGLVEGVITHKDVVQIPMFTDELMLVVGRQHPLYNQKKVTMEQLDGLGIISREDGSRNRNQLEHQLAQAGITLHQKWSCTNTEAIKNAVMLGEHMAVLSKMLIEEELKAGKLRALQVEHLQVYRQIMLIYHKKKYLSPTLQAFINIVKKVGGDSQKEGYDEISNSRRDITSGGLSTRKQ